MRSASAIETFGGSHSTAYGASSPEQAWGALTARALGAVEYPFGSNGLILCNEGNGANRYIRPASARRTARDLTRGLRAPADLVVFNLGLADLAANGASGGTFYPEPIRNGLRAMICFARLGAFYGAEPGGASDASISYGGTWIDQAATDRNAGPGYRLTATAGATVTISVPAQFPGGEIDLFWIASNSLPVVDVATVGASRYSRSDLLGLDYYDQVTGFKANYVVQRLTGLDAGAQTITVTVRGTPGFGLGFDGWGIADPDPPNVVLSTQLKATQAVLDAFVGPMAGDTPTASTIDRLNGWIGSLLPEFNRLTLFGTPEVILETPNSTLDGMHPNDVGHRLIAKALLDHVDRLPTPAPAPAPKPAAVTFAANWSNTGGTNANATHTVQADRHVRLAGRVTRTVSPSPPETIFTLPERHRPAKTATFLCNGSAGTPAVTVNADGTVQYAAGSLASGGTLDLDQVQFQIDSAS